MSVSQLNSVPILWRRLCDVVHSEKKLTLVFEYSDQDLKKYFDSCNGEIDPDIVKVRNIISIMSSQQQQIVVILYLHYFTANLLLLREK